MVSGEQCVSRAQPRAIGPLSTAYVTSTRPTFRFEPAVGADGTRIEIATTADFARIEQTIDATTATARAATPLPPGAHFWRLRALWHGAPSPILTSTWEFIVRRESPVDSSFGSVPDLNLDGIPDLVVGENPNTALNAFSSLVCAHAYFATATRTIPAAPSWTWCSPQSVVGFSQIVRMADVGDVNGDGVPDLAVAAITRNSSTALPGFYIASPSRTGATPTSTWFDIASGCVRPNDTIGFSIAPAGDFNGDGYADVVVGCGMAQRAYLYFGSSSGLRATPDATFDAGAAGETAVLGGVDIDGDGLGDVIVSNTAGLYFLAGNTAGSVSSSAPFVASTEVQDGRQNGHFNVLSVLGDIDGDGYGDIAVGSPLRWLGQLAHVFVYRGSASGLITMPAQTIVETGDNADGFAQSVGGIGDVDGDGHDDLAVGAPNGPFHHGGQGTIYIYPGALASSTPRSITITTLTYLDSFGHSIAGAGDVNGDGIADVVVSAPSNPDTGGTAYLYLGSAAGLSTIPAVTLASPTATDVRQWFGVVVQ